MAKYTSTGATMTADANAAPYTDYVPVIPAATELEDGPCRAILCDEDGALNLTTPDGTERESVLVLRGINPLAASVIDDPTAGTAPGSIVALY